MVIAETLPSGLRLVTESMPHVRSVTVGVWLTRGSRHESDAESGVAHFVEHMLFKGTTTRSAQRHRADDRLDRRPARRVHGEGIRELLHQGARRASADRDRSAERHDHASGARARRRRERAERHPRRDQDGRGRARRSGARDLRAAVLGAGIRWAGRFSARPRRSARSRPTVCASTSTARTSRRTSSSRPRAISSTRSCAISSSGRSRTLPRAAASTRDATPPAVTPGVVERHKDIEQSHLCIGTPRLSAGARRSARALRAQHDPRRLDELAAVPAHSRGARPGLRGLQQPDDLQRRRACSRSTPAARATRSARSSS